MNKLDEDFVDLDFVVVKSHLIPNLKMILMQKTVVVSILVLEAKKVYKVQIGKLMMYMLDTDFAPVVVQELVVVEVNKSGEPILSLNGRLEEVEMEEEELLEEAV